MKMVFWARFFIKIYQQTLSPFLGALGVQCRFYPSCSRYALLCFEQFSFQRALWYSMKRLCKCHPFYEGGEDFPPVVSEDNKNTEARGLYE